MKKNMGWETIITVDGKKSAPPETWDVKNRVSNGLNNSLSTGDRRISEPSTVSLYFWTWRGLMWFLCFCSLWGSYMILLYSAISDMKWKLILDYLTICLLLNLPPQQWFVRFLFSLLTGKKAYETCTPLKINMDPKKSLKITQLKRNIIFQTSLFVFHVNFPGCISQDAKKHVFSLSFMMSWTKPGCCRYPQAPNMLAPFHATPNNQRACRYHPNATPC